MEGAGGAYELCSLADVVSCGVCGLRLEALAALLAPPVRVYHMEKEVRQECEVGFLSAEKLVFC